MNLTITGHHLDVTPAIRGYVEEKMGRVTRHFDQVIDVSVILSVDKLQQKAEANVHVPGKDIYVNPSTPTCTPHSTPLPTSSAARSSSTRKRPATCTANPVASKARAPKRMNPRLKQGTNPGFPGLRQPLHNRR